MDKYILFKEYIQLVDEKNFYSFFDLVDYCYNCHFNIFKFIVDNPQFAIEFFNSSLKKGKK